VDLVDQDPDSELVDLDLNPDTQHCFKLPILCSNYKMFLFADTGKGTHSGETTCEKCKVSAERYFFFK
jgi:hypothetical protein